MLILSFILSLASASPPNLVVKGVAPDKVRTRSSADGAERVIHVLERDGFRLSAATVPALNAQLVARHAGESLAGECLGEAILYARAQRSDDSSGAERVGR